MQKKNSKNFFCFWDKCIWICCNELPLLRREYLSSAVNGLANSPETFHIIKRDFLNLNCLHRDWEIWKRRCRLDFNSFSTRLPCYLWKSPQKRDFLDIYLTTFFGVRKLKNTSANTYIQKYIHLFFENVQNLNKINKI